MFKAYILSNISEMDKMKVLGFPLLSILFDDPHTQTTPLNLPHIHQNMRKGCRNDYIETYGVVCCKKNK